MRAKGLLVAMGAAVVLAVASPVPAQAHVLTCAGTRLEINHQLYSGEESPYGLTEGVDIINVRVGPCRLGRGSKLAGVYHRHIVYWVASWTVRLPLDQGFRYIPCHGTLEIYSLRVNYHLYRIVSGGCTP